MKKIQLWFLLLLVSTGAAFSQACVIDTNNTAMFGPPSEELPCVIRDSVYDITLQIFCPPVVGPVTIDSIRVTAFHGLPAGITKTANPLNGTIPALSRMCISIQGTTQDTVGTYEIIYDGTVYTSQGAAPFSYLRQNLPGTLPEYYLTVINAGQPCPNAQTTGINRNILGNAFTVYPNPNNGEFQFELNAPSNFGGEINVRDVTGRLLYSQKTTPAFFYKTTLDISNYTKGIYLVEYRTGDGYAVKKVTVE